MLPVGVSRGHRFGSRLFCGRHRLLARMIRRPVSHVRAIKFPGTNVHPHASHEHWRIGQRLGLDPAPDSEWVLVMSQISSTDCGKLLELAGELHTVPDSGSLPQHVLRALRPLIPYEFGGCHFIEPTRHHIAACYDPEPSPVPSQHKEYWRLTREHPLHRVAYTKHSRAWKLSDVLTRQALLNTEFYRTLYRPLGVNCEMVAALPDHQTPSAFLVISLHRRKNDFSERDRLLLNLLLPQLAAARRRLLEPVKRVPHSEETSPLGDESRFKDWLQRRPEWALTQREVDVLFWLCQGKTNSEIGKILGIAERTAETHALHIYPKIGVENRYNAIATLSRMTSAS